MIKNEKKFWDILTSLFVGAEVKGKSGFINLMIAKQNYFGKVKEELLIQIEEICKDNKDFKDELYDKLYSFFHRYFSISGSIYYNYTPLFYNIYTKAYGDNTNDTRIFSGDYEQVISNKQDTSLFYKTQMLYYVKSDKIFKDLEIEIEDKKYIFDVSNMQGKKANEKKSLVYELKSIENNLLAFNVNYSENGKVTKIDNITKEAKKSKMELNEADLKKAFQIFEKQSNIDYFINKDAKKFLFEQLDMWIYQYMFSQEVDFNMQRFNQIQDFKKVASKIINFISQFENELVKIWNKPRFVLNSNIVVTIDKLKAKGFNIDKLKNHKKFKEQQREWEELGIIKDNRLIENEFMPIDTKYFSEFKDEIESLFEPDEFDGLLIKSENYQALNTILPRFKDRIDLIYIDPPFNTGDDFAYIDKFQNSTWLSLMENRLELAKEFLSKRGSFYLHLDENADFLGRMLLGKLFSDYEIKKITMDTNATKDEEADLFGYKSFGKNFALKSQTIYFMKTENSIFNKLWKPNRNISNLNLGQMDLIAIPKKQILISKKIEDFDYYIEKYNENKLELLRIDIQDEKIYPVSDIWNDLYSFTQSEMRVSENISFQSSQKPENLIRRVIQSSSKTNSLVMDFFAGSGTTCAVSHKLKRKYIGIETGEHFYDFYYTDNGEKRLGLLGRMKNVINGDIIFKAIEKNRRSTLSKNINYKGGGIFKYYELEQYEQILRSTIYKDTPDDYLNSKESSEIKDCFLFDEKLSNVIIAENDGFKVNLGNLYPNIDLKETIHNITGKRPKKITDTKVIFEDREYELIEILKPLLVW